ncbi:MAG: endonuclease, partial [Actinobacteria bacterium]|nr:endonuclease [Actinomycetota bacterium]
MVAPGASFAQLVINEVDSDTPGTDAAEFIELFGAPLAPLDGLVVVLFNGSAVGDASYAAFDLDGFATDAGGFFVLGNAGVAAAQLVFAGNVLQNGPDAVALYEASASDFPNGTPATSLNLRDAVVYDTADPDDPALLHKLTPGHPQADEAGGGDSASHASARVPNGGAPLVTSTYVAQAPTPGESNEPPPPPPIGLCGEAATPIHAVQGNGPVSPLAGMNQVIEGVVVADFQGTDRLSGFFLQEEDVQVDADPATSEGIFVFDGSSPIDVQAGDVVRAGGTVTEFFGLTELSALTGITVCSTGTGGASRATVTLPTSAAGELE